MIKISSYASHIHRIKIQPSVENYCTFKVFSFFYVSIIYLYILKKWSFTFISWKTMNKTSSYFYQFFLNSMRTKHILQYLWILFDRNQYPFWKLYVFVADDIKIFLFFIFLFSVRTLKFFNFWKKFTRKTLNEMRSHHKYTDYSYHSPSFFFF